MEWEIVLAVIGVGILVGFINTLAGSGSVISLPLLIWLGLPATVANGTNRIAILFQSITGVAVFKKHKKLDVKKGIAPSISAVAGSIIGANIAVELRDVTMEKLIGVVMVVMLIVVLYKPGKWLEEQQNLQMKKTGILQIIIFFFIGIYGGLIQAGVGIFLLSALVLNVGFDLVKANAIKLLIVALYTPFVLVIFIYHSQVDWTWGLILAAGNIIGAFIASKFAVSWGPKFIRWVLITVMGFSAIDLLGIFDLIKLHLF